MLETTKYIVYTDEGKRILTSKGFRRLEKLNNSTIRLFNTVCDAKYFLNKHVTYYKLKVDFKKVKVSYEEVE